MRKYFSNALTGMAVTILLVGFTGCNWLRPDSPPDPSADKPIKEDVNWGRQQRSRDNSTKPTGLSEPSKDIERSLGIE